MTIYFIIFVQIIETAKDMSPTPTPSRSLLSGRPSQSYSHTSPLEKEIPGSFLYILTIGIAVSLKAETLLAGMQNILQRHIYHGTQ